MGCGASQKEVLGPVRLTTVTGRLKITITNAHFDYEASLFKMDPYIRLKLSNQVKETKVAIKADKQPTFMQTFQFHINSCYKMYGRNLEVMGLDKKKLGSDNEIGFGIVDLDPVVNFKKPKEEFRCFLSHSRANAGFVNIIAEFIEQPSEILSFRFQTASIRRKTSTFGSMHCRIRVTIGEQILMTTKQKDTKQAPPVWKDQLLTFTVPKSVLQCLIQVLDDDEVIGDLKMELAQLLKQTNQQNYNEEFQYDQKVNAGSLKFNSVKGVNPTFSEIKVSHRKKKPEQEEKKEEQKKVEEKKVEEIKILKKQQEKKQETKLVQQENN